MNCIVRDRRDHWREAAACRGKPTIIFFPVSVLGVSANLERYKQAESICATCTVTQQCLEMMLVYESTDDKWGMYGGKTPAERRVIRDQRRRLL